MMILETAVQVEKVMQDFDLGLLLIGGDHSQRLKAPPNRRGYRSQDCVNLSASTAVFRMISVILLLSLCCTFTLEAEIEQIVLSWRSLNCDASCEEKIVQRLQDFHQIESVNLIPGAGQAVVKWKEGTPFSYSPLNIAMRRVGPSLQLVQMVVRGKVEEQGDHILLISEGDGTRFLLLNPTAAQDVGVAVQGTMRGRELSVDQQEELLSAKKEGLFVTISGNLFQPFRSPPFRLIISDMSIGEKEPAKK